MLSDQKHLPPPSQLTTAQKTGAERKRRWQVHSAMTLLLEHTFLVWWWWWGKS